MLDKCNLWVSEPAVDRLMLMQPHNTTSQRLCVWRATHNRTTQDTAFPDAFKAAHAADPDARLCLNDLSLIEAHNSPRLMEIINKHVWAHDAPIHCIGIQVSRVGLAGCRREWHCPAWHLKRLMS
jgi:GH35 family endo-1,4-beta-xylanase